MLWPKSQACLRWFSGVTATQGIPRASTWRHCTHEAQTTVTFARKYASMRTLELLRSA